MKTVLVQPNLDSAYDTASHPHAGLAYLAAYAIRDGHDVSVIDAKFEQISNAVVVQRVLEQKPDVLGLTVRTPDIKEAESIAAAVKRHRPETTIVVGGAHVSGLMDRVLEECPHFDMAVYGEGEVTFSAILRALGRGGGDPGPIDGTIVRRDGTVQRAGPRDPIADLDSLPFPAWHLFPDVKDVSLFTSRGCPFQCNFCQRVMGNKVRRMSPHRVLQEIKWCVESLHATYFQIEDEVFGVDRKWLHATLDLVINEGLGTRIKWFANSRVNVADFDTYSKMKTAGCLGLGFGIESGNQQILNGVHKGFKLQQACHAIDVARRAGLATNAFFILGHPHETSRTIRDTINFAVKLKPTTVCFGMMIPYPGTQIYDLAKAGQAGYRGFHEEWDKYTKYFGRGLEVNDVSRRRLAWYQKQAYLEFYLRTGRINDLGALVKRYLVSRN